MPGLWDEQDGGFVTFIQAQAPITNVIGAGDDCGCWPDAPKEGASLPYLMYTRAGGKRFRHLTGATGARRTVLHLYAYGATRAAADALMELCINALDNFRGTWSGVFVNDCQMLMAPEDGEDKPKDSSGTIRYWQRLPLGIIHGET